MADTQHNKVVTHEAGGPGGAHLGCPALLCRPTSQAGCQQAWLAPYLYPMWHRDQTRKGAQVSFPRHLQCPFGVTAAAGGHVAA